MKIKPIIKTPENKNHLAEWVVDKFPQNYKEMTYFEPFLGSGSVLLYKEPSVEEVVNDSDSGLISIWRSLRDEPKLFSSKIKRIKYKEEIFKKYQNKKDQDYLNVAVTDFILRHMSKSGQKRLFLSRESKSKEIWGGALQRVLDISKRLKEVHMLNRNSIEIIGAFSKENCLMYCDPPSIDSETMDSNKHVELGDLLRDFRGKVIISSQNTALYKRIYASWNRKGVPNKPKESIWLNF
jgi:DNA adenine methylase